MLLANRLCSGVPGRVPSEAALRAFSCAPASGSPRACSAIAARYDTSVGVSAPWWAFSSSSVASAATAPALKAASLDALLPLTSEARQSAAFCRSSSASGVSLGASSSACCRRSSASSSTSASLSSGAVAGASAASSATAAESAWTSDCWIFLRASARWDCWDWCFCQRASANPSASSSTDLAVDEITRLPFLARAVVGADAAADVDFGRSRSGRSRSGSYGRIRSMSTSKTPATRASSCASGVFCASTSRQPMALRVPMSRCPSRISFTRRGTAPSLMICLRAASPVLAKESRMSAARRAGLRPSPCSWRTNRTAPSWASRIELSISAMSISSPRCMSALRTASAATPSLRVAPLTRIASRGSAPSRRSSAQLIASFSTAAASASHAFVLSPFGATFEASKPTRLVSAPISRSSAARADEPVQSAPRQLHAALAVAAVAAEPPSTPSSNGSVSCTAFASSARRWASEPTSGSRVSEAIAEHAECAASELAPRLRSCTSNGSPPPSSTAAQQGGSKRTRIASAAAAGSTDGVGIPGRRQRSSGGSTPASLTNAPRQGLWSTSERTIWSAVLASSGCDEPTSRTSRFGPFAWTSWVSSAG
eukprot:jgi/Chrpa1/978/Chrysochromulina_OHIO_Genome00000687-RA